MGSILTMALNVKVKIPFHRNKVYRPNAHLLDYNSNTCIIYFYIIIIIIIVALRYM